MLGNGYKKIEIARVVGVDKSTITREIKRNADGRNGVYRYGLAQRKAEDRKRTKPHAVVLTPEVAAYIERRLIQDRWLPEQISERAKLEGVGCVSTTTIYRHIAADRKAGGALHKYLRRHKPYRKLKGRYTDGRGTIRNRRDISERPPEVDAKARFGDLEVDTVVGANHKGALLTINDRLTGYLWIRRLEGKNATELAGKAAVPLFMLGEGEPRPVERLFCEAWSLRQPVMVFQPQRDAAVEAPMRALNYAWPPGTEIGAG